MKIILTGGGTGGHLYPLVAVAQKLSGHQLRYLGPFSPHNVLLINEGVEIKIILGAKLRRYWSWQNLIDIPKFFISIIQALGGVFFF
jgi:UDP-N-acetylglucosamine--N-acetylmuramyl-(pentapeptide) pyrophosphoryl-undecaprenol N-acetylglucosamine transferase